MVRVKRGFVKIRLLSCFYTDLLRQQEELKRLEEMKNEQIRRRQEMDLRYLCPPTYKEGDILILMQIQLALA